MAYILLHFFSGGEFLYPELLLPSETAVYVKRGYKIVLLSYYKSASFMKIGQKVSGKEGAECVLALHRELCNQ